MRRQPNKCPSKKDAPSLFDAERKCQRVAQNVDNDPKQTLPLGAQFSGTLTVAFAPSALKLDEPMPS